MFDRCEATMLARCMLASGSPFMAALVSDAFAEVAAAARDPARPVSTRALIHAVAGLAAIGGS
eukprot:1184783-Prorocentrum_minimum.AAC.2